MYICSPTTLKDGVACSSLFCHCLMLIAKYIWYIRREGKECTKNIIDLTVKKGLLFMCNGRSLISRPVQ